MTKTLTERDLSVAFGGFCARHDPDAQERRLSPEDIARLDDLRREVRKTVATTLTPLLRELMGRRRR